MASGDEPEGYSRTKIDAAGGIVIAHDARHIGPDGIEARDRRAVCAQHTGVRVRPQTGEGPEAARQYLYRVEGAVLKRRDARVGLDRSIPLQIIREGRAAPEGGVEIGAVECIAKPTNSDDRGFDLLPAAIRNAARARLRPWSAPEPRAPAATNALYRPDGRIVAIGSSTGGVEALIEVVSGLPANCPPTVITQHMPPLFTKSLASRLDRLSAASVAEATDGALLEAGRVFLAPGGAAHLTVAGGSTPRCRLSPGEAVNGHRPSVDVLFHSVARASRSCVGIILTGMGRDGAEGLRAIRQAGGTTFGQDEASSVVYGMPKIAFELGAVERQLPLRRIPQELLTATNALDRETP